MLGKGTKEKEKPRNLEAFKTWNLSPTISRAAKKNTLLRVTPTMTSIRFVAGIPSGILSGISSGILSGISYGILSGILSGKSSGICSGKHSGTLSDIPSGILSGISSGILSGKHSGTLSGISSGILSDILSGVLSGISSGILSGRWGPAVLTELGKSQVEVQRCSLSSEGPRLRSSGAHWARKVPGWGPAVLTELGSWRRVGKAEVNRCWDGRRGRGGSGGGGG